MHVEKIKIIDNTYPSNVLQKGLEFECDAVNLLVGNQGCGKSTLLKLLHQNHKDVEITLSEEVIKKGISTFYFDTESGNPRLTDPQLFTNPNGTNKGIGMRGALMTRFESHGETLKRYTVDALSKAKDCVIFLDEPESGLSITNQFKLIESINGAVKNNCQLFIATHCYPLIEMFDIISLQHNKKMSGIEFIKLVR